MQDENVGQGETPEIAGQGGKQIPEANATGQQPTLEELKAELDAMRKSLQNANRTASIKQKALEALEAEKQQREQAEMSEADKLKADIERIKREAEQTKAQAIGRVIRSEVVNQATQAGFVDPADAYALLDKAAVTFDEDGEPDNVKALIADLAKAKPHLIKKQSPTLGATNPGGNAGTGETDLERKRRLGLSF